MVKPCLRCFLGLDAGLERRYLSVSLAQRASTSQWNVLAAFDTHHLLLSLQFGHQRHKIGDPTHDRDLDPVPEGEAVAFLLSHSFRGHRRVVREVEPEPIGAHERALLRDVVAEHLSERERRADGAERELLEWKKVRFMADTVGERFFGFVIGVQAFGLFVELTEVYVQGLVHVSSMTDDYYRFVEKAHLLKGENTKTAYRLGDRVEEWAKSFGGASQRSSMTRSSSSWSGMSGSTASAV